MSFQAYVHKELLGPLDMRSTTYQLQRGPDDDVACGWQCRTDAQGYLPGLMRLDQNAWSGLGAIGLGAGRVQTNAEDLVSLLCLDLRAIQH
jgi:CubicO group peptidase (beta-lactamase class C family)